jgi:5-methylcytosine-specific restriction endonuclease McrA
MRRNFIFMERKTCSECGQNKPIEEFYLNKRGRIAICDSCRSAKCSAYYQKNKEAIKAGVAAYQKQNRAAATENHRRWKEKQPSGLLAAQTRARRAADPDRKSKQNAYREGIKDRANEQGRIRAKEKYHQDIEASRAKGRAKRAVMKEYYRALAHAQLSKKTGIYERYPESAIADILRLQRGRCAYCGKDIRKYFEVDHIEARANGGGNGRSNIQLTCLRCNRSKGKKDPIEFAQSLGRLI